MHKLTLKNILLGTGLSVLVFFSVSFISVLSSIHSPLRYIEDYYHLKIGFPFTFYYDIIANCPIPICGWIPDNLLWDCFITWIVVVPLYILLKRK